MSLRRTENPVPHPQRRKPEHLGEESRTIRRRISTIINPHVSAFDRPFLQIASIFEKGRLFDLEQIGKRNRSRLLAWETFSYASERHDPTA